VLVHSYTEVASAKSSASASSAMPAYGKARRKYPLFFCDFVSAYSYTEVASAKSGASASSATSAY